ncbi:ABC transporter FUM19 [Lachnellula cervina]|uniref:ABC transporter FUM19 n=1 Tax=Lachnellula cervina TaxID=1316786 RepID=A0A7D8UVG6_9HELO|nr:ABC transporter FUM19 [Lachnellula cervina]
MAPEPIRVLNAISSTCAAIFLLCLPIRLWELRKSSSKASPNWQGILKAASAPFPRIPSSPLVSIYKTSGFLLSVILLSYLAKFSTSDIQHNSTFFVSLLVSLLAALGLSLLLFLEQQRSPKPSDLATLYLLASLLCDVVVLTVPSGTAERMKISRPILIRCCMHTALLLFECCGKRSAFSTINKHQSPEELSGVLSRALFTWINPILLQGYRNILIDQDLPTLSQDMKPEVTKKAILNIWSLRARPETRKTLPIALLKAVKKPFLVAIIPRLFLIACRYSQPTLIKRSIRYVLAYSAGAQSEYGYWLVVSAVIVYVGLAITTAVYQHCINRLKLLTRSALVGLIHDKTMKSPSIANDNGEATTLMSTDADSLDGIAEMVHEIWAQVVEVVIGIVLLSSEVGWIWPLPLFLIYMCSHVSRFVAKQLHPRQKAWNNATQNRVAATSSMLSAMKTVKMLGFQHYLSNRIRELRKEELFAASKLRWLMVYYNASANALGLFSPSITLVVFAVISGARGQNLNTETAFTTMAILTMVTHPANMVMTIIPRAVASFAGFDRIQSFLLRPSLRASRGTLPKVSSNQDPVAKPSPAILIQQLGVGGKQLILEDINLEVPAGSMTIISGPTGSGKSTLLRAMLGEVVPTEGTIRLSTQRIGYCAQRPWLPSGNIKEVIQGTAEQGDDTWYHEVINMCCLTHDLSSLPEGDHTHIGSRGLNLSGGQRQRVALARALFARFDIVLLDDIFSGLDGETEKTVFDNLFGPTGLFQRLKTTAVLVSNSTQYFQAADHIVILEDHGIKEQGNWQTIKGKASSIAKFTSSSQGKHDPGQSVNFDKLSAQTRAKDEAEIDLARQTGDSALYGYYFGFVGLVNLVLYVTFTSSYSFFFTIPQYWLQLWTESNGSNTVFYTCGFLFLSIMSWTTTNGIMWSNVIRLAPQSGMRLHQRLLHIVTNAPLSYFSKTENGSILNRFSQDIQLIDKQLPTALSNIMAQTFKLLMQIVLLFIAQRWLTMSLPACMLFVYIVQKIYLRTSRQLRFLELESRAGVFSSFLESVEGLETIRAFDWSEEVIQNNILCVEKSQRPEFLLFSLQRWLNLVLDLLTAFIAISVVAIAVVFRGRISGGQVGIALNIMLVANSTLLKLVENWTTLEISLGAIARLKMLESMTPSEGNEIGNLDPPDDWPSGGQVEFKDITASYHTKSLALRNISLNINAGQKLMICGRTGSGKSTLLLTLLRILELQAGKIEIDGIDISHVRLDVLRERCFIAVSQDPLLLSNETLRFNLNPYAFISDETVIDALRKTGLWSHFFTGDRHFGEEIDHAIDVLKLGEHPVLDKKLSLFQELSVGQCQLFALCRALVKTISLRDSGVKPVVLLDEVTSSLDSDTESIIHRVIDEEFTGNGHTVIIVAHRLSVLNEHTETGRDVVALMGDGRLLEVITDLQPSIFQALGERK